MSPYNRNERRGILLLGAAVVIAVGAMFLVRECDSRGDDSSGRAEQIILTDSLRAAKADSASLARKNKKSRRKGTARRKGRRKAASSEEFPSRDILGDTIATVGNSE